MVLDEVPDSDEVAELAEALLEDFPSEDAWASCEIVYTAPDFLCVAEQDQINAYLRDGSACVLVVYMSDNEDDI